MTKTIEEQKTERDYIREILESTSYVLYEMEDIAVQPNPNDLNYIKYKNPLFYKEIIDNKDNRGILKILSEDIPFYFLDDDYVIDSTINNESVLQMTRDSSKTDVPSYLQTDFWSVWFNDAWGSIQNSVILDIYNMLKYPMINENQYLNTGIFSKLSDNLYSNDNSLHIDFMDTEQDYSEDVYFKNHPKEYFINYVERINSIIDQKLSGIYDMLNYKPDYFQYLSDLCDSLINSGTLDRLSVSKEKSVYKLQDIQYELLRRKFAGSATLYDIALASIGRQGGLNRTIELGKLRTSSTDDKVFRDKRKIKILNLPGILTENNFDEYKFDPLTKMSLEYDNQSGLPMDVVTSLYYTSGTQGLSTEGTYTVFRSDDFYEKDKNEYRRKFLRDISSIIDWDELGYVSDVITATNFYFALDEKTLVIDPTSPSGFKYEPRQLDSYASYTDQLGQVQTTKIRLDVKIPSFDRSNISGVMFDISANKVLYHENALQKTYKSGYQYVTYPISDDKSLSLMDNSIVDYMRVSTGKKSRVQDRVDFGTQISYYADVNYIPEVEDNLFAIGYQKTIDGKVFGYYTPEMKFAILYYVSIKYNIIQKDEHGDENIDLADSFRVTSVIKTPITKITLNNPTDSNSKVNKFIESDCRSRDIYPRLLDGNVGILPLTYSEYIDEAVTGKEYQDLENPDISFDFNSILKVGVIEKDGELLCYDDANDYKYTVANFIFGESEYASNLNMGNVSPKVIIDYNTNPNSEYLKYYLTKNESLSWTPKDTEFDLDGNNIKGYGVIYYSICRSSDVKSVITNNYKYSWSDPIFYISIDKIPEVDTKYYPEWMSMKMQINPYMNVTRKSASPMRYVENNIPMYVLCDSNSKEDDTVYKYIQNEDGSYSYVDEMDSYPSDTLFYIRNPQYNVDWSNIHNIAGNVRDGDIGLDFAYKHIEFKNLEKYSNNSSSLGTLYYKDSEEFVYFVPETDHIKEVIATNIKVKSNQDLEHDSIYCDVSKIDSSDKLHLYTYLGDHYEQVNINIYIYENSSLFPAIGSYNSICYDFSNKKYYLWQKQNDDTYAYTESNTYTDLSGKIFTLMDAIVNGSLPDKEHANYDSYYVSITTKEVTVNNETLTIYSYKCFEWVREGLYEIPPSLLAYNVIDDPSLNKCIYLKEGIKPISKISYMDSYDMIYATYRKVKYDNAKDIVILNECNTIKYKSYTDSDGTLHTASSLLLDDMSLDKNGIYLYDLRVYEKDYVSEQNNLMNGSIRYQYSCSPSVFKLAYSLYRDLGMFKNISSEQGLNISGDPTAPNRITGIRLFNRGVWDSIYVDRYPMPNYEEGYYTNSLDQIILCDKDIYLQQDNICYTNDAINQNLTDSVEVNNSIGKIDNKSESLSLVYKGHTYKITDESLLTIVNTTLYPIHYKEESFASDGSIPAVGEKVNNDIRFKIKLPVDASKNTLKYFADVNVNMISKVASDLSNPINNGSNIEIIYDKTNKCPVSTLKDISIKSDASKNYIMVPLKMAKISSRTSSNFLDKFHLSNFKLSNSFTKMLNAKAYYNEVKIPIAITDDGKPSYMYKYDAIRLYKEGTYYLTVKYPMMILPMFDYDFVNSNYPVVYGSMRFKIEVRGKAVSNSTYTVESDMSNLSYGSYAINLSLMSTSMLCDPIDNRLFPHREIDIKLYAMTNDGIAGEVDSLSNDKYHYSWDLIASNNREDITDDIVFIDNDVVKSGIFIKKKVSLYMSRNYTMPFFLAHQKKQNSGDEFTLVYDSTEADDDLIDPIEVGNTSTANADSERLFLKEAKDIDTINLYSFKDYSLLFDNTSKLTEYTYTNNYYDNMYSNSVTTYREGYAGDLEDEKNNYSRLSNVLDRSAISDYMYNECIKYENLDNVSGYKVENGDWVLGTSSKNETCFGNPYSGSKDDNRLYDTYDRNLVSSAYNIQYVMENYGENDAVAYRYSNSINEKINTWTNLFGYKFCRKSNSNINEQNILSRLYDALYTIYDMSSSEYMLSELSTIEPHFICRDNSSTDASLTRLEVITENLISNAAYDLYSYSRNPYKIMTSYDSKRFTISRNGLYNNNLIDTVYFTNDYWYGSLNTGTWEKDDLYGKDVYKVSLDNFIEHTGSQVPKYKKDSDDKYVISTDSEYSGELYESDNTIRFVRGNISYSGNYEIAINVKDVVSSKEVVDSIYAYLVDDDNRVSQGIKLNKNTNKEIYEYTLLTEESVYDESTTYFVSHNIYFKTIDKDFVPEKEYYILSGSDFILADETHDNHKIYYEKKVDYTLPDVIVDSENFIDLVSKGLYTRRLIESWSVYSNEVNLEDIYANGVEFVICPKSSDCTISLGKPIVRLAVSGKSHTMGLSNIMLSNIVRDNKFVIPAAYLMFYKSKINDLVVTCQLKGYISNDRVMFNDVREYILNRDTTQQNLDTKMRKLLEPWVRNIVYTECDNDGNKNVIKEYSYRIGYDSFGKKTISTTELGTHLYNGTYAKFSPDREYLELYVLNDSTTRNNIYKEVESTFDIYVNRDLPISVENEKFSALTDCFNPSAILAGRNSNIAITNIQFLSEVIDEKGKDIDYVLYELEYLPIVYNEKNYHFSINFMLNQNRGSLIE